MAYTDTHTYTHTHIYLRVFNRAFPQLNCKTASNSWVASCAYVCLCVYMCVCARVWYKHVSVWASASVRLCVECEYSITHFSHFSITLSNHSSTLTTLSLGLLAKAYTEFSTQSIISPHASTCKYAGDIGVMTLLSAAAAAVAAVVICV
jgi:hypothetical protein